MSALSNDQGRAYEFICLLSLEKAIKDIRPVKVELNSSYYAAERAWNTLTAQEQQTYKISAEAAIPKIFELEPRILEDGGDLLELLIQQDQHGQEGDVRDILIIRRNITWEIGLSIKHNHFAVKHSRLSRTIDFGKEWFGVPCSQTYWDTITPIFNYLQQEKVKGTYFRDLPDKENDVYVPIVRAFIDEVNRQYKEHDDIPAKMVEYLMGKYDFYKLISIDNSRITRIQTYNVHGTLNQSSQKEQPTIEVPIATLPTRIVALGFVPRKKNTAELYMDGGWQFTFRIHNAEDICSPSLKFDIQIIGMPTAIFTIDCNWN